MKQYLSTGALFVLCVGTASAEQITIASDFFGTQTQSATFSNTIFNNNWKSAAFDDTVTEFPWVWNYGLKPNAQATLTAGTLYYDTNKDKEVASGNEPSLILTTSDSGTSASLRAQTTGQGKSCAVFWNTISADDLALVKDLSLNFNASFAEEAVLDIVVFYMPSSSTSVTRLALLTDFSDSGEKSLAMDFSGIDITEDGKFVISIRTGDTAWKSASLSDLSWVGTAIPEPSAFAWLAGLGALTLVGTRRRRK